MSEWMSTDGLSYAEVRVLPPDGYWPAMVSVEPDDLCSMLPGDAQSLAAILLTAALEAEGLSAAHFGGRAA